MNARQGSVSTTDIETALRRGPLTAEQLRRRFGVSKPTLIRHLGVLRQAGRLVESEDRNDREYAIRERAEV